MGEKEPGEKEEGGIFEDRLHTMTLPEQLYPRQVKSFQTMTAWLQNSTKNIYKANNFRLKILGNKRVLEKTQIGWRQMQVPSQPSSNKFLVIVVKIYTAADSKFSSIVQFCLIFLLSSKYFIQDVRCLLYLEIHCELQEKKLYLKTFKNLTPKTRNSIINYHETAATQGKILQYSFFNIPLMSPTHPIKLY